METNETTPVEFLRRKAAEFLEWCDFNASDEGLRMKMDALQTGVGSGKVMQMRDEAIRSLMGAALYAFADAQYPTGPDDAIALLHDAARAAWFAERVMADVEKDTSWKDALTRG
jgi:hypothetical protein